jgi:hypothetical protein
MPEREGLETIRALKGLDPDVKIIAISLEEKVRPAIFGRLRHSELAGSSTSAAQPGDGSGGTEPRTASRLVVRPAVPANNRPIAARRAWPPKAASSNRN